MNKRKAEKGLQTITKFLKSVPSITSDRHSPGRAPPRGEVNGSPQQSKDARTLLTRSTSAEKKKPLSPAMKDRKQFFGVSVLKSGGLGRGKDPSKPPETGKAWSSNDYFTGVGQSADKQPATVQGSAGHLGASTSGGNESVSDNTGNKTSASGKKDQDVTPGYRISVIGEKVSSRPGEEQGYRGNKIGTLTPRGGQDGKWSQGRKSDMPNNWKGNLETPDRREVWRTPGRDSNRAERMTRDSGKDSYTGGQPGRMETDKKLEGNQIPVVWGLQSGDKVTERTASSPNVGVVSRDRYQPSDRDRYQPSDRDRYHRQFTSPNRSSPDRQKQRHSGSPQYNSPRSRQEKSNYYSPDRRFDRNRTESRRNSRAEFETGSKRRTENECTRSRDTGNVFSPQGRDQGQSLPSSGRSHSSDRYLSNDTPSRSPYRDSSSGSDGKPRDKRGSFDAGCTLSPDRKYVEGDKLRSKSLNESKLKEQSSQSSASFQKTDRRIAKTTIMGQDPNICTKDSSLNMSNWKTTEQKRDEAGTKSRDQRGMVDSTITGQKSDNAQKSPIMYKSRGSNSVETEIGNDHHGQDSSLLNRTSEPQQNKTVSMPDGTVHQGSNHPHIDSRSTKLSNASDSDQDKSSLTQLTPSTCTKEMIPVQTSSDMSERQKHVEQIQKVIPSPSSQENVEYSSQSKSLSKPCTETMGVPAQKQLSTTHPPQLLQKDSTSVRSSDRGQPGSFDKDDDAQSPVPIRPLDEGKTRSFDKEGINVSAVSMKLFDIGRMGSYNKEGDVRSPKRQYSCEGESPRRARHSSGSSLGRGNSRDSEARNRNVSGGSTHSIDTGRARSHSRDTDNHVRDKRSHHTSHSHEHRKVAREKSSESNFNSDSSSGGNQVHSHRHHHRSKGDKSNDSHRHRHRSKGDSSSYGERKEAGRQRPKDTSASCQSAGKQRDGDTSSQRYRRMGSTTESRKQEDHYAGGSDVDIDEEDSDDELETPFFLTSLTEASSRPIPSTPTKGLNASYAGSPTPSLSPQISLAPLSSLNSGFSLDALLAEAIDKTSEERQCEDMHAVLEEGLRKGGFVKDTLEVTEEPVVDEDLLPEHQLKLKKFQICKSQMSEVHPGESIFLSQRYQCLFNADISLQACGFVPGTTYIDKHLITVQPGDYITLLTSDIMLTCFDAIACQDAVLRWLLFIMSVHSSHLLINSCYKTIQEHLYSCQHFTCKTKYTWSPAVMDVLSILCNYGADPNKLLPKSLMPNTESVRKSLFQQQNMEIQPAAGKYNRENLRLVLNSLAMAFQIRPKYSGSQITQMVLMLCKAALDKSLNNYMLTHEFEVVLASLLKLYTEADWSSQSLTLCRELSSLTEHHHNQVYLAQLLPPTTKGNFLQRRVSFLMVHHLFYPEQKVSDDVVVNFQLGRVHNVLPRLQGLADEDIYLLASSVSLLDLCIGNGLIKSAEKDDLEYITDQMKKLTGEVRDNVQMLDKTRIKDMMIRITSKWTLVLLSIGSKQRTLFECPGNFRKSPADVKIETVDASQTDQASETEEEEEDDSQSEEEEEKPQMKVQTVTIDVNGEDVSAPACDERMDVDDEDDLPEL